MHNIYTTFQNTYVYSVTDRVTIVIRCWHSHCWIVNWRESTHCSARRVECSYTHTHTRCCWWYSCTEWIAPPIEEMYTVKQLRYENKCVNRTQCIDCRVCFGIDFEFRKKSPFFKEVFVHAMVKIGTHLSYSHKHLLYCCLMSNINFSSRNDHIAKMLNINFKPKKITSFLE